MTSYIKLEVCTKNLVRGSLSTQLLWNSMSEDYQAIITLTINV